jgi:hypothetical protein
MRRQGDPDLGEVMPTLVGFGTFAALPEEEISEKISRRILSGDQGMLVWVIGRVEIPRCTARCRRRFDRRVRSRQGQGPSSPYAVRSEADDVGRERRSAAPAGQTHAVADARTASLISLRNLASFCQKLRKNN